MKSVALNVGANSSTLGGRGPIFPDGSFQYIPIPEEDETVTEPTYFDLHLLENRPSSAHDVVVHFDPEFPEYGYGVNYTYGDRHAPKTTAISKLAEGDILFFYATLDYENGRDREYDWINEDWGAYLIGHFKLARDPVSHEEFQSLSADVERKFDGNAHIRRDSFDAEYLVLGDPAESRLYDIPVPLSGEEGSSPNRLVTSFSEDSGEGPWYRRPLAFDEEGTGIILNAQASQEFGRF